MHFNSYIWDLYKNSAEGRKHIKTVNRQLSTDLSNEDNVLIKSLVIFFTII